jgi:hypothetical protein
VDMRGWGVSGNLIQINRAASVARHGIDILLDPFDNGFNRTFFEQGGVNAGGKIGIMLFGKRFDSGGTLWRDRL